MTEVICIICESCDQLSLELIYHRGQLLLPNTNQLIEKLIPNNQNYLRQQRNSNYFVSHISSLLLYLTINLPMILRFGLDNYSLLFCDIRVWDQDLPLEGDSERLRTSMSSVVFIPTNSGTEKLSFLPRLVTFGVIILF